MVKGEPQQQVGDLGMVAAAQIAPLLKLELTGEVQQNHRQLSQVTQETVAVTDYALAGLGPAGVVSQGAKMENMTGDTFTMAFWTARVVASPSAAAVRSCHGNCRLAAAESAVCRSPLQRHRRSQPHTSCRAQHWRGVEAAQPQRCKGCRSTGH